MNQPPLNPDAVGRMFATAMMEVLDVEKLQPGDRLAHVNDVQDVLNRLEKNILAAALPEVTSAPELDALPYGSLVRTADGREFYKEPRYEYPWTQGRDGDRCSSLYLIHWGPVTVIHRPEVKP